jgi:carbon-monoxide dehydrogenase iron sulfur subunit
MRAKIDNFKCTGCRTCESVCALRWFEEINPKKAALRVYGKFPSPGTYTVKFCTQCGECAKVCPVGAITEKNGIYRIDPEVCIGCLACLSACPEEVIFFHPDSPVPIKCTWCGECMRFCPRQVIRLKPS